MEWLSSELIYRKGELRNGGPAEISSVFCTSIRALAQISCFSSAHSLVPLLFGYERAQAFKVRVSGNLRPRS